MSESDEQLRVLAVGAHPDDIEFGCGGVLLKEAGRGSSLSLVVCSRGESGTNGTPEQRVEEAQAAAAQLQASLSFLEMGGDGLIERNKENALGLARLVRELRPNLILAPTLEPNQHPDHAAVGELTREACRLARYGGVAALKGVAAWPVAALLHYAITPGGEPRRTPTFLVDIGAEREAWEGLMRCHGSQMKTRHYVDLQLARARSWGLQLGGQHAQALWSEDPVEAAHLGAVGKAARAF